MDRRAPSIAGLLSMLLFAMAAAMAAGLASGGDSASSAAAGTAVTIYVANEGSSSIAIYPAGSSGNATPSATIAGAATQLSSPIGLFVDSFGDIFAANFFATSVFPVSVTEYASTASGSTPPSAVIAGSNTSLAQPFGVALDPSGNIWVTNRNTSANSVNSVTEYRAGANHNIAPINTIGGQLTRLTEPSGIAIDRSGNIYVANTQSSFVTEFAPNSNGNIAPAALIIGGQTGLDQPVGIAVDLAGNIYVSNVASTVGGTDSISEYAAGSSGNVQPTATILGDQTGLSQPYGVAVDRFGNIYAANFASNTVTEYAAGSNGNVTPTVTLSGSALSKPAGVAIEATNATAIPTATPTPTPTATPGPTPVGLTVSPDSITFPTTGTDTKSTPIPLTIGNSGSVTLQLYADASGLLMTDAFKVTGAGSFKLPHNHARTVKIQFTPSSSGISSESTTIAGNINVRANNSAVPITVTVTGTAQSGILSAATTIPFGNVTVHKASTQTLMIQNTGLGVLHGKVIASALKKPFQLLSGGGAFTLSGGKTRAVKVRFTPTSSTSFNGTITITSDDPMNKSQSVAVSGTGS